MRKINLNFSTLSDAAFEVKAQLIIASMTDNPNFPGPIPELVVATTASTNYSTALAAAKNGHPAQKAVKNEMREVATEAFVKLSNVVTLKANGVTSVLLTSGFDLSKERQPAPPLTKPEIVKITDGLNTGELEITIAAVKGARYMYQYTKDPLTDANEWAGQSSTQSKSFFGDLESGKKYWCRVIAYGINDQAVYSDPVCRVVQ